MVFCRLFIKMIIGVKKCQKQILFWRKFHADDNIWKQQAGFVIRGFECWPNPCFIQYICRNRNDWRKTSGKRDCRVLICANLCGRTQGAQVYRVCHWEKRMRNRAGSADDTKNDETPIYYGSHRVKHLCIFVDCKKRTKLVKENIYVPTGKKMPVTNADLIKRCVYMFNNRPADE